MLIRFLSTVVPTAIIWVLAVVIPNTGWLGQEAARIATIACGLAGLLWLVGAIVYINRIRIGLFLLGTQAESATASPPAQALAGLPDEWQKWTKVRAELMAEADALMTALATAVRDGRTEILRDKAARFSKRAERFAEESPQAGSLLDLWTTDAFSQRRASNLNSYLSMYQRPDLANPADADQIPFDLVFRHRWLVAHVPPPEVNR